MQLNKPIIFETVNDSFTVEKTEGLRKTGQTPQGGRLRREAGLYALQVTSAYVISRTFQEYERQEAQHEEDLERMDLGEMMTDDDYDGNECFRQ